MFTSGDMSSSDIIPMVNYIAYYVLKYSRNIDTFFQVQAMSIVSSELLVSKADVLVCYKTKRFELIYEHLFDTL